MAGSVRAGQAYIEFVAKDAEIQQSIANLRASMATFKASVDAVGIAGYGSLGSSSTAAMTETTVLTRVATAAIAALRDAVYAVTTTFRRLFDFVFSSVTKGTIALIGMRSVFMRLLPKDSPWRATLDSFFSRGETTAAIGRYSRWVGWLTGSSGLRAVGDKLQRVGWSTQIADAWSKGFSATARAAMGVTAERAIQYVGGKLASVTGSLFRRVGGVAASAVTGSLTTVADSASDATEAITATDRASRLLAGTSSRIAALVSGLRTAALRVAGLAAAITGPSLAAARSFATASKEIVKQAIENGTSLEAAIEGKYGTQSMINKGDIQAGVQLADVLDELKKASSALWAQIGAAAIPILKSATETTLAWTRGLTQFVAENRSAIAAAISFAAKIGAVAAAGLAISGITAIWGQVAVVLSAIVSPLGLVAIGFGTLFYLFPQLRDAAGQVVAYLAPWFQRLGAIFGETIGGIKDALMSGDLRLAADVLWKGLELAWLTGSEKLRETYRTITTALLTVFSDAFAALEAATANTMNSIRKQLIGGVVAVQNAVASVQAFVRGGDASKANALRERAAATAGRLGDVQAAATIKRIEAERVERQRAIDEEHDARQEAARQELITKRKAFEDARAKAAELRQQQVEAAAAVAEEGANTAKSGLTGGNASFSAQQAAKNQITGVSVLQKSSEATAKNTSRIADLLTRRPVVEWAQ